MDEAGAVRWRPDRVAAVSDDGAEVWLFGGPGPVRLAGRGAGALADAVDGRRSLTEVIQAAVAGGMAEVDAVRIGQKWLRAGHLVTGRDDDDRARAVRCDGPGELVAALRLAGVDPDAEGGLRVTVVEDLLHLTELDLSTPAVAVQLRGPRALISPRLGPGGACGRCLVARLRNRRSVEFVAARRVGLDAPPPHPVLHRAAIGLVAGLLAADRLSATDVTVVDPVAGAVSRQRLTPVAGCPDCDPAGASVGMAHLTGLPPEQSAETVLTGGGLRVVDPDVTWQHYQHLIGDVVGVVPDVRQTGDAVMRTFSAGMNVAVVDDLMKLKSRLRAGAGGKGTTLAGARAGALAEAIERDSLRGRGDEPHRRARMADVPGAIHPNAIQLFSDAQLHRAAQCLALGIEDPAATGFHRAPAPFDMGAEHDWSPVADYVTGDQYWLPSSLLYLGWPGTPPGYPQGCSNGAAAGNTLPEALLQGLLELVERDSVALWWMPRCHRPAFDLNTCDDPRIEAALAPQRALGTEVWVLDVTSDLGIPGAVAVSTGLPAFGETPVMGYGAHVDPVIAVVRALTEMAQMQAPFASAPAGTPIDLPGQAEKEWFASVTSASEPWLAPHGSVALPASPGHETVAQALDDVVGRLTARGFQVLWADLTRPDLGLPVVRTFVPGLRHFWRRTGPGRIYDVPPALGWCRPGYTESDLNPWAMIL